MPWLLTLPFILLFVPLRVSMWEELKRRRDARRRVNEEERAAALAQAAASLCRESAPRRHVSAQVDGHALVILSQFGPTRALLAFDSKVRQLKQDRGAIYPLRLAPPFLLGKEAHAKLKHDWNA